MALAQALVILRRRWLLLLLTTALGIAAGLGYAARSTPEYQSSATVFFSLDRGSSVNEFTAGSSYAQDLVPSYAEVVTMPVVLDPVVADLKLDTTAAALARQISVAAQPNTVLMDIRVTDPVPATAAGIANAVAAQLATAVSTLSPRGGADSPRIRVTTTSPAVAATEPSSTDPTLVAVAAAVAGLLLGLGLVVGLELLSRPVRTRAAVAAVTPSPVVGTIVRDRRSAARPIPTSTHPALPRAERYRILRANLQFRHGPHCVVVTSALPGEGRTGTAVNLAVAMAHTAQRVLLLEADLRRPRVAALLGLDPDRGLAGVLGGGLPLDAAVQHWGDHRPGAPSGGADRGPAHQGVVLDVLVGGGPVRNPGELLASRAAAELLDTLRDRYDVVVVDTPPLLPVADAAILAGYAGEALLVVDTRRTGQRHLAEAVDRLHLAGAGVLGVVLNNVPVGRLRRYGSDRPPPAAGPTAEDRSAPRPPGRPAEAVA